MGTVILVGLSACASPPHAYRPAPSSSQIRAYAPPGPPSDPWRPYIAEASNRFAVPETWIREVMRQESGGSEYVGGTLITSPKGAMGLMQVMPETYEEMRGRYDLAADPYHPRNNILAGTAYIREMYDRFGSPGFLAAYNAGPSRLEDYLYRGFPLFGETVAYVAAVAPRLGAYAAPSGPLAAYARSVPEVSADELNRRSLAEHSALASATAPDPREGYAETDADTSADELNRRMLEAALSRAGVARRR
jgi:D-alanyl-D-alanine carboxypeptidase